jgi:pimeloyl-ACP methyl ester carboxylesterase
MIAMMGDFRFRTSASKPPNPDALLQARRGFLLQATGASVGLAMARSAAADPVGAVGDERLGPRKYARTDVLQIAYHEMGPRDGPAVLLLHGFPYDVHSYVEVAPRLAARGHRVIVPHLRGHGETRFLDPQTPRSGQQGAVGADLLALMDALGVRRAVVAGYDWGGRAACIVAALWPQRCLGLVSVNSYLIQDIAHSGRPAAAQVERGLWYQFYLLTERGRAGLAANRRDIARIMWKDNSPTWQFDQATFARSAAAFENPDYVDVVVHSYRHRLGAAPGYGAYEAIERQLSTLPVITVPAVTLDGAADGVVPATDGQSTARYFTARRVHRQIPNVGHNLPQEAPVAFADAVSEVAKTSMAAQPATRL